jgi:dihydrofolate reductase
MRKVVVYEMVSLDGVAEAPDRFFTWDDRLDENLSDVIGTQDAVVLGRRSYDEWAPFWPSSDLEPFASFVNDAPKYVATSSPLDPTWPGASVIEGDLVAFVRALRDGEGGDIGVHASISVAQTLLAADLVDEVRLVIAPTVVGAGRRLFEGVPERRFELARTAASPSGSIIADYRRAAN